MYVWVWMNTADIRVCWMNSIYKGLTECTGLVALQPALPLSASRRPGAWRSSRFQGSARAATPAASTGRTSASRTPAGAWTPPLARRSPAPCSPATRPSAVWVLFWPPPPVRQFQNHCLSWCLFHFVVSVKLSALSKCNFFAFPCLQGWWVGFCRSLRPVTGTEVRASQSFNPLCITYCFNTCLF